MGFKTKLELSSDKTITLGGKDVNTNKDNPKKIEGYYLGSRVTPDKGYGPGLLHFFSTLEGNVGVWGKSRMNNLLTSELAGQMVRVTFTGMSEARKGRRASYMYKVEHDSENTIDVSGVNLQSETGGQEPEDDDTTSYSADASDDVSDVEDEHEVLDEVAPVRASRPSQVASTPSAERQAKVRAMLSARK